MLVTTISVQLQDVSLNNATVLDGIHDDKTFVMDDLFLQGSPKQFRSLAHKLLENFPEKPCRRTGIRSKRVPRS